MGVDNHGGFREDIQQLLQALLGALRFRPRGSLQEELIPHGFRLLEFSKVFGDKDVTNLLPGDVTLDTQRKMNVKLLPVGTKMLGFRLNAAVLVHVLEEGSD